MGGDLGSFKTESKELRDEGAEWAVRATHMGSARDLIDNGSGMGYKFGISAQIAKVGDLHDTFITSMIGAADDGKAVFSYLDAALHSAANAYDGVDSTVAQSQRELEKELPK